MQDRAKRSAVWLSPVQVRGRRAVSMEVARVIQAAISDGRVGPGDQLPAERDLSRMLGVSRSSLRDALKVLTGMGLVQVRRNRGVYIAAPDDPQIAAQRAAVGLLPHARPLSELFELRRVIEAQTSAWAAERADEAALRRIDATYAEFSLRATAGVLTAEAANRFDADIHSMIAAAAGNSLMAQMVDNLRQMVEEVRGWRDILKPRRIAVNVADLGVVVDALRRRDKDAAREAMIDHLLKGEAANLHAGHGKASQVAEFSKPHR